MKVEAAEKEGRQRAKENQEKRGGAVANVRGSSEANRMRNGSLWD